VTRNLINVTITKPHRSIVMAFYARVNQTPIEFLEISNIPSKYLAACFEINVLNFCIS